MGEHFIHDVEFKNFKCFQELKVEGTKRVNLIGGKNNIGKTSFMEGLELLVRPKSAFGLRIATTNILRRRQAKKNVTNNQPQVFQEFELDFFSSLESDIVLSSGAFNTTLKYIPVGMEIKTANIQIFNPPNMLQHLGKGSKKQAPVPFLEFSFSSDSIASSVQDVLNTLVQVQDDNHIRKNVNFISSCTTDEISLATYYGSLLNLNQEEYLNDSLKLFDENIVSIKAIPVPNGTILKLKLNDRDNLILLSSLGEGINRYIAILCAIWASKDGYLFIDEIENGIHWTNYEKLWKIIFEASAMANCQVFATTHSKECIEAFNRMNEKDDGVYLEFYRNQKTGLVNVQERGHEQLAYSLTHGGEIRGE